MNESTVNVSVTVRNSVDVDGLDVTVPVEEHSNTTTLGPGGSESFEYETVTCGAPIFVEAEGDGIEFEC